MIFFNPKNDEKLTGPSLFNMTLHKNKFPPPYPIFVAHFVGEHYMSKFN